MKQPEKLLGYCMILLGAAMLFSIFAAAIITILTIFGLLTWFVAIPVCLFAVIINLTGVYLERRFDKNYAKTLG